MIISIYHKDKWVYLKTFDGGEQTSNEKYAYDFTKKEAEAKEQELKDLKIQVKII